MKNLWEKSLRWQKLLRGRRLIRVQDAAFPREIGLGHFAYRKRDPIAVFHTSEDENGGNGPLDSIFLCHLYDSPTRKDSILMLRDIAAHPGNPGSESCRTRSTSIKYRPLMRQGLATLFKYGLVGAPSMWRHRRRQWRSVQSLTLDFGSNLDRLYSVH